MSDPYAPRSADDPDPSAHTPPTSSPAPPLSSYGTPPVPLPSPYAAPAPGAPPAGPQQPGGQGPANPYGPPAGDNPYASGPPGAPVPPYGAAPQAPYPGSPYPQYGPGYGGYGYSTPPQPKTNSMAIAAMVLSLVGLMCGITAPIGAILGHVALNQIKQSGEQGRGMALTGIIVGWIITGFFALGMLAVMSGW